MQDRQQKIRDKLNTFIKKSGRKANWVSQQCNLDGSIVSRFRNNKRDLWDSSLDILEEFLNKYDTETTD